MEIFISISLSFILLLRSRKDLFFTVALVYGVVCFGEALSTMLFVPQDEFRLIWFYTNIAGFYILLGQSAGVIVTLLSAVSVLVANPYLSAPFSPNARCCR